MARRANPAPASSTRSLRSTSGRSRSSPQPFRSATITSPQPTAGAFSTWHSAPWRSPSSASVAIIKRILELKAAHGTNWPVHWLEARGIAHAQQLLGRAEWNRKRRGQNEQASCDRPHLPRPRSPCRFRAPRGTLAAGSPAERPNGRRFSTMANSSISSANPHRLINNQITQSSRLAEQIQNQLRIYQNMLQNTAQLPTHVCGAMSRATSTSCARSSIRGRASPFPWAMSTMSSNHASRATPTSRPTCRAGRVSRHPTRPGRPQSRHDLKGS